MVGSLGARLTPRQLTNFNQLNRDAWVRDVSLRVPAGARLLDMGAGTCLYRDLFPHCEYITQDFAQLEGLAYGRIDLVSDVTDVPAPDASFDAILCTEVLEHVPDPMEAIAEAARLLIPGGRLFLSAPLGSGLHQEPFHYYGGFTPHFYVLALERAGLELERIQPNGGLYRHLLQELQRGGKIIGKRRPYSVWHPLHWFVRLVPLLTTRWLTRLDDEIAATEFTVGYHVEARKPHLPAS